MANELIGLIDITTGAGVPDANSTGLFDLTTGEVSNISGLNQQLATTDTPTFAGMNLTADLTMGTNRITGLLDGIAANDAINKGQLDTAITGLGWINPVEYFNIISDADQGGADPSGVTSETWVVNNWLTQTDNHVVYYDGAAWQDLGLLASGDRCIVSDGTALGGNFAGQANQIGDYTASWAFTAPVDGNAAMVIEGYQADSGYTYNGTNWVQFTGAGQINAGEGLTKSGNTLNIGQGTGITVNADTIQANDSEINHNSLLNTHNLTTDIDHATIQNIGINSHADIDTHITQITTTTKLLFVDGNRSDIYVADGSRAKPYKTIQAGITVAASGTIVEVESGTYNENLIVKAGTKVRSRLSNSFYGTVTITGKVTYSSGAGRVELAGIYVYNTADHALEFSGTEAQKLTCHNCKFETNSAGLHHALAHTNTNASSELCFRSSMLQVSDTTGAANCIKTSATSSGSIELNSSTIRITDNIDNIAVALDGAINFCHTLDEIKGGVTVAGTAACTVSLINIYTTTQPCITTNSAGTTYLGGVGLSTASSPVISGAGAFAYNSASYLSSGTGFAATLNGGAGASAGAVKIEAAVNLIYDNTASGLIATQVQAAIDEISASVGVDYWKRTVTTLEPLSPGDSVALGTGNFSATDVTLSGLLKHNVDNGEFKIYGTNTLGKGPYLKFIGASAASNKGNLYILAGDYTAIGAQGDVYIQRMNNGSIQNVSRFSSYRTYLYTQLDIGFATAGGDVSFTFHNNKGTNYLKHRYADEIFEVSTGLDITGRVGINGITAPDQALHVGGEILSQCAEDTDFDSGNVLNTGIISGYGILTCAESTAGKTALYRVDYHTLTVISAHADFSTIKGTAGKYNVYWETDQFKVQNNFGDNKKMRVGFMGTK